MKKESRYLTITTLVLLALWWLWYWSTNGAEIRDHHPNIYAGSWGLSLGWLFTIIIVTNATLTSWFILRSPRANWKTFVAGIVVFALVVATFFVSVPLKREQALTYYIANDQYDVPWEFNPLNGQTKPGGTSFTIHVTYPDLTAQYRDPQYYESLLTLTKSTRANTDPGTLELTETCLSADICQPLTTGYFTDRNGTTYYYHYQGEVDTVFKTDIEVLSFKNDVINLFNSFQE